jgi:ComF family protein
MVLTDSLIHFLFPPACPGCRRPVPGKEGFCPSCEFLLERFDFHTAPRLDLDFPVWSPFMYGGPVRDAILRLKHSGHMDAGRIMAGLMADHLVSACVGKQRNWDLVVPVPSHPGRLVQRGFNPAAVLARGIARSLRLPLAVACLLRTGPEASQQGKTAQQRHHNVANAFCPRRPRPGRNVLLVDDVMTSGATLHACATTLQAVDMPVTGAVVAARVLVD